MRFSGDPRVAPTRLVRYSIALACFFYPIPRPLPRGIREGELRSRAGRLKTPIIGTYIIRKLGVMQSEKSFPPLLWGD